MASLSPTSTATASTIFTSASPPACPIVSFEIAATELSKTSPKRSGLGLLDNTACALFADFSNSGRQDAIIVRTTGPLLFLNDGHGKFQLKPDAFHFANEPQGTFTGAAIADYDRDGWLDIYFCLYIYYQGTDQYRYPSPYYDANNGPPNFMFRNNRDGSFRDVTKETNLDRNNTRFSFCCGWNDYDGDGWPDLYVVNDFGRKNLYRNNGNGTFTDVAAETGVEDVGAGMSVCWFDSDNDGKQDLYVADMWTAAGERISKQDAFQERRKSRNARILPKTCDGEFSLSQSRRQSIRRSSPRNQEPQWDDGRGVVTPGTSITTATRTYMSRTE